MLKKLLIAIGAVLVLLVVVAVGLLLFVDVNRFKPMISETVAQRYQRTLTIDGDLSLSLFPRLAITLPATSLSEPAKDAIAARIGSARVAVALLPLLRGRVEAERVTLDGLDARVRRFKDGRLSIDDLLGAPAPAGGAGQAGEPPAAPAPGSGTTLPLDVDIGGLTVSNARLAYEDDSTGNVATLDGLSLETGRIAPGAAVPVTMAFKATSKQPAASLDTTLTATVVLPQAVAAQTPLALLVEKLALNVTGKTDTQAFEARVASPRLALGGSGKTDTPLSIAVTLAEAGQSGQLASAAQRLVLNLEGPFSGNPDSGEWRYGPLAGQVEVANPALGPNPTRAVLSGQLAVVQPKETAAVELGVKLDDSTLNLKADVAGFGQPRINAAIQADRLDLDRFLPPDAASPAGGQGAGGGERPGSAGTPAGSSADAPIDLTGLNGLDVTGRVQIGELRARGLVASQVAMNLRLANGHLQVNPLAATLYQGKLAGSAGIRSGSNQARADVTLTGMSIGPLLAALSGRDLLEGRGDLRATLNTAGPSVAALKRGLNGQAGLKLADGAIKGINLAETIRNARSLLQGGSVEKLKSDSSRKTDFTSLAVSFTVKDGVASSNDLDARSPLFRIGGEGRVDLPADRIDYTVQASVVGTSTGQGGKELEQLRGVTIPVRLTGPLAAPDWQIDWATAGREALKSRAAEELKERLKADPRVNELEDKVRERAGDALRGLFKR